MSEKPLAADLDQLMAEADALIQQIDSGALDDMHTEHRIAAEKHARHLKQMKSDIEENRTASDASDFGHGARGVHEAIQDITKAMHALARYLA